MAHFYESRKARVGSDNTGRLSAEEIVRQCENSHAQSLRHRTPKKSSLRLYFEQIIIIFAVPMFLVIFISLLLDVI